jgi:hypothetical protein
MPMRDERIVEAAAMTVAPMVEEGVLPDPEGSLVSHVVWMVDRIPAFLVEGRREKAMRWLGFIQGVAAARGYHSIESLKDMNRPAEDGGVRLPVSPHHDSLREAVYVFNVGVEWAEAADRYHAIPEEDVQSRTAAAEDVRAKARGLRAAIARVRR